MLQAANNTPDPKELVRTTITLVYGDMKEKSQKVLSDSFGKNSGGVPVKEDGFYYADRSGCYKKGASNKKGNNFGESKGKLRTNLVDLDRILWDIMNVIQQNLSYEIVLINRWKR